MDIRQFTVFKTVCKTGSVTETARQLNVSQPAISKTLRQIKFLTGLDLFQNVGGRLYPTAEAQSLLPVVGRLLASHDDVKRHVTDLRSGERGLVTVACFPSLMSGLLANAIAGFRVIKPQVRLRIVASPTHKIVELVANSAVDIGVCQPSSGDAAVNATLLASDRVRCVLPEDHRLAKLPCITPADLDGEKIITFPDADPTGAHISEAFQQAGIRLRRSIEVNQSYGVTSFVKQGLGIGILDAFFNAESLFQGLVSRPFEPVITTPVHILTSATRPLSPLAADFLDELETSG